MPYKTWTTRVLHLLVVFAICALLYVLWGPKAAFVTLGVYAGLVGLSIGLGAWLSKNNHGGF